MSLLRPNGFTLIELLVALALGALVMLGLQRALVMSASVSEQVSAGLTLDRDARFAFERMVGGIRNTTRLVLPLQEDPSTDWLESRRIEAIPALPPTGSSGKDTAVLAVALPFYIDTNGDGVADADNDGDGRIDEDWPADSTNDGESGLRDIDDDGDGLIDEDAFSESDDESGAANDDPINGADDNADTRIDEDPGADMNGDGGAGVAGVDDDEDGAVDEGSMSDDDEDGLVDEDWLDTLVYYLNGSQLIERRSVPWDESGDGLVNGSDYVMSVIASGVSYFSVERVPKRIGGQQLVGLRLDLVDATGRVVSLRTQVQVGGGVGGRL